MGIPARNTSKNRRKCRETQTYLETTKIKREKQNPIGATDALGEIANYYVANPVLHYRLRTSLRLSMSLSLCLCA
jgi:hypothetical protein